jgi:RHS repeat-associated protein
VSNKSNPSAQVISLPKGGGALRGIGETFAPDLHTGTGNFTIPIAVPPGRQGFQPTLGLVYSTGAGHGAFGHGWSLGIPGISRKTCRGIPRYRDDDTPDTFLLSGAEDLVPIATIGNATRYRPRTEGLFARIEHRRDAQTDHWEVRSTDGLISVYGTPGLLGRDPGVIRNPQNPAEIFSWSLTETRNPFGNLIRYEYEQDAGDTTEHVWDQRYLRRIRYADHVDSRGATAFLVFIDFLYEERPDPFSDYRAGFEIRTTRRCTRIDISTHSDRERHVRTYRLVYLDQRGLPLEQLPATALSLLSQIVVEGHDGEVTESLPALELSYTVFEPARQRYQPFTGSTPSRSLAHPEYELVDLFGSGLPAVLEIDGDVRFWRNRGHGRFDLTQTMQSAPAGVRLSAPGVQLLDAEGNGRADLMVIDDTRAGYYPLSFDGKWEERGFVGYQSIPPIDLDAPDVRLVDLDGDGITDALRTGTHFELYYNNPEHGWRLELRERTDSDSFPNVTFDDPRVKLADMTGDGLQDIVVIQDGCVRYWPYLGYGRWGRCVTMRNGPRFDDAVLFAGPGYDPRRLLMGDVDGDGVADLLYVSTGQVTVWINQNGNGWSDPILIDGTPPVTNASAVRLADMLGHGTDGVLWTYDFGTFPDSTYKFLDLTGGLKPYMLHQIDNQMGAVTRVAYAPSTQFSLADDERPETRWRTTLPFPVQVVARVEVIDLISHGKLTTEYRYHHGYWDGIEREFRGFGTVEQLDTETFADYHEHGLHGSGTPFEPVSATHFSPPLLTKTWFHQGPVAEESGGWRVPDYSTEYWSGDPPALREMSSSDALPVSLDRPQDRRDALRAFRGRVLRTELYALDGASRQDRPYTVTEKAYSVREESPPLESDARRRIFFPHVIAERATQWERGDEPMTQFAFSDAYDRYGQSLRKIAIAVPRRRDYRAAATAGEPYLATVSETEYAQRDDDRVFIVNRVSKATSAEVLNDGSTSALELCRSIQARRFAGGVIGQTLNYYDGDAFEGLPFGALGDFGALVRAESLVLTEEILRQAYSDEVNAGAAAVPPYFQQDPSLQWPAEYPQAFRDSLLTLAGYRFADGSDQRTRGYFTTSSQVAFDFQQPGAPTRHGLPLAVRDPFGHETTFIYDIFRLLPVEVVDPVALRTRAEYDYRVLQPRAIVDSNGNRRAVTFTPLGLVASAACMGKEGERVGDTEQDPGVRLEYDFLAFAERRQPASVRSISRFHHVTETDVPEPERAATFESVMYSDGFGRVLQVRTQADDVLFGDSVSGQDVLPADQAIATGDAVGRRLTDGTHCVIVSGMTVYDNKGRVIEQYEPFFATGLNYEAPADAQLVQRVSLFYDPRGQLIRTRNRDGSEHRVIHGVPGDLARPDQFEPTPWETYVYDANDLAALSVSPEGTSLSDAAPATHAFTPTTVVVDAHGRAVEAVTRNRDLPDGTSHSLPPVQEIRQRSRYDIRGNLLTVTDALGRTAFSYSYDLAGCPWRTENIDGGVRRVVYDAAGNEIERRDSKGAVTLFAFDRLQRPTRLWARDDGSSPITLRQCVEYGDGGGRDQPEPERSAMRARNLLGQPHRHHDEAGLTTVLAVDFKGNVVDKARRLISDAAILSTFDSAPANGWRLTPFQIDWQPAPQHTLADRERDLLEETVYETTTSVDALNRVKWLQFPRDVEGRRRELRQAYKSGGGLDRVWLDDAMFVNRIAYNARGQRVLIAYGNGVMTRCAYDQLTFRLKRLRTERYSQPDAITYHPNGEVLQDYGYDYDLVGNIVGIRDRAPGSGVLNNPEALTIENVTLAQLLVSGNAFNRRFVYDALYRLRSASGRECDYLPAAAPWHDEPRGVDLSRSRPCLERYSYDAMGNLERLEHRSDSSDRFVREFTTEHDTNRFRELKLGDTTFDYAYDGNGNIRSETTSRHFEWNHADQLRSFRTQTVGSEPSVYAHYLYDSTGRRVKKLVRRSGGHVEATHYIDGLFEHHRWGHDALTENNHLWVADDAQPIAQVRVGQAHPDDRAPAVQFHFRDHLGSCSVTTNLAGTLTNREEFTPYGETSFGSVARKRYRFTGCERDEESGLSYQGARYYSPGLTRWASADPMGVAGGLNSYCYARNNPCCFIDPGGLQAESFPLQPDPERAGYYSDPGPGETIEIHDTVTELDIQVAAGNSYFAPFEEWHRQRVFEYERSPGALSRQERADYYRANPESLDEYYEAERETYGAARSTANRELESGQRRTDTASNLGQGVGVGVAISGAVFAALAAKAVVIAATAKATVATGSILTSTGGVLALQVGYGVAAPDGAPPLPGPFDDAGQAARRVVDKAAQTVATSVVEKAGSAAKQSGVIRAGTARTGGGAVPGGGGPFGSARTAQPAAVSDTMMSPATAAARENNLAARKWAVDMFAATREARQQLPRSEEVEAARLIFQMVDVIFYPRGK